MAFNPTTNGVTNLLYKKNIGIVDAYPALNAFNEAAGNAKPIITQSRIQQSPVPTTLINDWVIDMSFNPPDWANDSIGNVYSGKRYVSATYPYMVKYVNVLLRPVNPGISYRFNTSGGDTNYCAQAIAPNYTPDGQYDIVVTLSASGLITSTTTPSTISVYKVLGGDTLYPWQFDIDAGYLTFVNAGSAAPYPLISSSQEVRISYYTYEGKFGTDSSGNSGSGTNTVTSLEPLLTQYVINPPPAPDMSLNAVSTPTCIYIPFSYPRQIIWGGLGLVPLINNVTIFYNGITSPHIDISRNILFEQGNYGVTPPYSNEYIQLLDLPRYDGSINAITGVVLTKNMPTLVGNTPVTSNGIYNNIVFPQDNSFNSVLSGNGYPTRNAYIYNDSSLNALITDPSNIVTVYYRNFSPYWNSNSLHFDVFLSIGLPSPPTNLITLNYQPTTTDASYGAPLYGDASNIGIPTPITNYKLTATYDSNTISFTPVIAPVTSVTYPIPPSSRYATMTGLYPDSSYNVYVEASNDGVNYGADSSLNYFSTTPIVLNTHLSPSAITTSNLSPYTAYSNVYIVDSGLPITPYPLLTRNVNRTFSPIQSYINDLLTRGKLGTSGTILMNLSATISGGVNSGIQLGPSVDYYGFDLSNNIISLQDITNNNIEIQTTSVVDYSSTTGYKGYYALANIKLIVQSTSTVCYTPSKDPYTLKLIRYSAFAGATSSIALDSSSTFIYYYDKAPSTLAIPNFKFTLNNPTINIFNKNPNGTFTNTTYVSGVIVLYNTIYFIADASGITGLDSYFYHNVIAKYTITQGLSTFVVNETNLNHITTGVISFQIVSPTSFYNNQNSQAGQMSTNGALTNFSTSISAKMTVYNIEGSSADSSVSGFNCICDPASVLLVYATLQQNGPGSVGGSGAPTGYRIFSDVTTLTFTNTTRTFSSPYTFTNAGYNSVSYSAIPYDNTWNIMRSDNSSTSYTGASFNAQYETQVANGLFVSSKLGFTSSYLDYRTYYYSDTSLNTVNYSVTDPNTTNYRWVTFAWSCPFSAYSTIPNGTSFNNLSLTLYGVSAPVIFNNIAYLDNTYSNKIEIYYRIEDDTNGFREPNNSLARYSSIWIAGNDTAGVQISTSNYATTSITNAYGIGSTSPSYATGSPPTLTFKLINPIPLSKTMQYPILIYFKIGLPKNSNCSFSNITLASVP